MFAYRKRISCFLLIVIILCGNMSVKTSAQTENALINISTYEQVENVEKLLEIASSNSNSNNLLLKNADVKMDAVEESDIVAQQLLEKKVYKDGTIEESYVVDYLNFYETNNQGILSSTNPPVDENGSYIWTYNSGKADIVITHRAYFTCKMGTKEFDVTIKIDSIGTKIIDQGTNALTVNKIYQEMIHYSIEEVGEGNEMQSMTTNYPSSGYEYKLTSTNHNFYGNDGIGSVCSTAVIYFSDGTNTGTNICINLVPYNDPD